MSIVPELLHLLLDDPPLVVAGAVVVGVHKDAVQVPPQLVLLMQDPINLGHSELLRDRRPRLNIEIFSLNSNIFSEFLFFSVSSLKLPAYGFALPPRQYRLRDGIVPELFSKHLLGERDYGAEEEGHPVVGLLEGDDEDVDILDLVQQRRRWRSVSTPKRLFLAPKRSRRFFTFWHQNYFFFAPTCFFSCTKTIFFCTK